MLIPLAIYTCYMDRKHRSGMTAETILAEGDDEEVAPLGVVGHFGIESVGDVGLDRSGIGRLRRRCQDRSRRGKTFGAGAAHGVQWWEEERRRLD